MEYDEEHDELRDQFHKRGDYATGNPDLAVGSTARLPESAPMSETKHTPGPTRRCTCGPFLRRCVCGSAYCPHMYQHCPRCGSAKESTRQVRLVRATIKGVL